MLGLTIPSAQKNCALGPSSDGAWFKTPSYCYLGTTGHAEMLSLRLTATGSTSDLPVATGLYDMHVYNPFAKFDYADTGPNKLNITANLMFFYGSYLTLYTLFHRDRAGAVSGASWDGTPLDHYIDDNIDRCLAMRSNWTDSNALYVAMNWGNYTGHQMHGELDAGSLVLDAMGWAGELGNGD